MSRSVLLFPLSLVFVLVGAFAGERDAIATKSTPTTSPAMLAALESVAVGNLRADLTFLASDEMGGRDTPSAEQRLAARFLRARLQRLGWQPGAKDGFFHTYELESNVIDETRSKLVFRAGDRTTTWTFANDYFLPARQDARALAIEGRVVFAGKGTKDDFESKALAGAWALVLDGDEDVRDLGRRARRAKCVGLVVTPGPGYAGKPYAERCAAALLAQRKGRPRPIEPDAKGDEERSEAFSTVLLNPAAGAGLLALAGANPKVGTVLGDLAETRELANGGRVTVENVCGLWPGSDPVLGRETILISAHYDHIGISADGQVNNGADDNGSGTSGLLAIAEALAQHGPMRRSVMLIWVSGEEKGLWGSKAWCDTNYLPGDRKAICDVNIDMIGRNAPDYLLVTPTAKRARDYNGLVRIAEALAPSEGFPTLGSADEYYTRSDHANFAKLGIPVMFLFSDVHEDYHRPTDDVEKIDFDKVRRVSRLVLRVIDALQTDTLDIGPR